MFEGLNWFAIVVSTFVAMALGFVWYTPILFGNIWMKLVGLKAADIDAKDSTKGMVISLIGSFISAVALAIIIKWIGYGLVNGLLAGAGFSFAFIVTTFFSQDAYEHRPLALTLINSGYRFIYFLIIGAILALWH
ncbi:MAG: DUF1761 domain-containing protein [Candidatus Aminicenantes bacterium]|nr:DUF1761 domain-containing protein [Candidatus Aminicenantes bacterium]